MLSGVEFGLSYQRVQHSSVEIRPLLFDEEVVSSLGSAHFEHTVDFKMGVAARRREVEITDEGQGSKLLQIGSDGRLGLHCVHYYGMSITNGQHEL